jgi:nucleoporin POM152
MNGTPRVRSSYPTTPGSGQRNQPSRTSPQDGLRTKSSLPNLPDAACPALSPNSTPLIPVASVDAPSQRFYVLSFYVLLWIWCLYDWLQLIEEDTQSIGQFMKWTCIYAIFSYGVPQLRIPWLEWSTPVSNLTFVAHAIISFMLMLRVPVSASLQPMQTPLTNRSYLSKDGSFSLPRPFSSTARCRYRRTAFERIASCITHLS